MRRVRGALLASAAATLVGMSGFAVAPTAAATYYGWCQTATRTFYYHVANGSTIETNRLTETVIGCWNSQVAGFKVLPSGAAISVTHPNSTTKWMMMRYDRKTSYSAIHTEWEWAYGAYHYHANTEMRVSKSASGTTTWGEWNYCYRLEDRNNWSACGYSVGGVNLSAATQMYFTLIF